MLSGIWKSYQSAESVSELRSALDAYRGERDRLDGQLKTLYDQKGEVLRQKGPEALTAHLDKMRDVEAQIQVHDTAIADLIARLATAVEKEQKADLEADQAAAKKAMTQLDDLRNSAFFEKVDELLSIVSNCWHLQNQIKVYNAKAIAANRLDMRVMDEWTDAYNNAVNRPLPLVHPVGDIEMPKKLQAFLDYRRLGEKCGVEF